MLKKFAMRIRSRFSCSSKNILFGTYSISFLIYDGISKVHCISLAHDPLSKFLFVKKNNKIKILAIH